MAFGGGFINGAGGKITADVHVIAINESDPEVIWTLQGHIVTTEEHIDVP
jgi:hypothetical protein